MTEQRYTMDDHLAYRQEQDEKARKAAAERRERVAKGVARSEYLRAGGTAEAFEAAWPGIRAEQQRKRAADTDREARSAQRSMRVSRI